MVRRCHQSIKSSIGRCTKKQIKESITVEQYCKKYHLTDSGTRDRIARRKVKAFKAGGIWWIVDL